MPCTDGGVPYPPTAEEILERKTGAMLCAIFSVLTPYQQMHLLKTADWKEAGVKRGEFEVWWANHQRKDGVRKAREQLAAEKDELKRRALAKLSPEEIAALKD